MRLRHSHKLGLLTHSRTQNVNNSHTDAPMRPTGGGGRQTGFFCAYWWRAVEPVPTTIRPAIDPTEIALLPVITGAFTDQEVAEAEPHSLRNFPHRLAKAAKSMQNAQRPLPGVITRGRDNDQMLAKGLPPAALSAKRRIMAGCRTAPDASLEMKVSVYRTGIELRVQLHDAMLLVLFSASNRPAS